MRQIFPENLSCSRRRRSGTARTRHPPVAFHRGGRTRREPPGSQHKPGSTLRPQRAGRIPRGQWSGGPAARRASERVVRALSRPLGCQTPRPQGPRRARSPLAWAGYDAATSTRFHPAPCFSPRFFCLVARITTGHRSDRELTNLCSRFFFLVSPEYSFCGSRWAYAV